MSWEDSICNVCGKRYKRKFISQKFCSEKCRIVGRGKNIEKYISNWKMKKNENK